MASPVTSDRADCWVELTTKTIGYGRHLRRIVQSDSDGPSRAPRSRKDSRDQGRTISGEIGSRAYASEG